VDAQPEIDKDDAPAKQSKATSITVMSQGQSITIELRGNEDHHVDSGLTEQAAAVVAVATTTTPLAAAPTPALVATTSSVITTQAAPTTLPTTRPPVEEVLAPRPLAPLVPKSSMAGQQLATKPDATADGSPVASVEHAHSDDAKGADGPKTEAPGTASYANLAMRAR